MSEINLRTAITDRYKPFLEVLLGDHQEKIHSVYIVGSALTLDFDPKISDINSVIVLHEMDLKFLELLAPLGRKYGKKRISAPLIMTPAYIDKSRDVFPIEFLNIKLLHHTVFGQDIFKSLDIDRSDLRHQCERELKVKLIGLRQFWPKDLQIPLPDTCRFSKQLSSCLAGKRHKITRKSYLC